MFNKFLTVFVLFVYGQGWALHCSNLKTVSDPRLDSYYLHLSSNEKGEAFLSWLAQEKENERLEVSYKTENSGWSFPESLTDWQDEIYDIDCFIGKEGSLCVAWSADPGDEPDSFHFAEKSGGNAWNYHRNWIGGDAFNFGDTMFDLHGNLFFVGSKPDYYPSRDPGIVLFTKLSDKNEITSDTLPLAENSSPSRVRIAMNKNGVGYAFWVNSNYRLNRKSLMCQKVASNRFVSESETIASIHDRSIYDLDVVVNENGDVAVVWVDEGRGKVAIKQGSTWTTPFTIAQEQEKPSGLKIAIDNMGNVMTIYEVTINRMDAVKTIYKPANQAWQSAVLFSVVDAINWRPNLKLDGMGNFVAIWEQENFRRHSIFGATFSPETETWSDPQRLSPQGEICFGYTYIFGAPGKGYIAWLTTPNGFDTAVQVAELSN